MAINGLIPKHGTVAKLILYLVEEHAPIANISVYGEGGARELHKSRKSGADHRVYVANCHVTLCLAGAFHSLTKTLAHAHVVCALHQLIR